MRRIVNSETETTDTIPTHIISFFRISLRSMRGNYRLSYPYVIVPVVDADGD
jgi:hypothetical protein